MNIAILSEVGTFCLLPQIDTNPLLQRQRPNLWHGECKHLIHQRRAVQQLHSELLLQKTNKQNQQNKQTKITEISIKISTMAALIWLA